MNEFNLGPTHQAWIKSLAPARACVNTPLSYKNLPFQDFPHQIISLTTGIFLMYFWQHLKGTIQDRYKKKIDSKLSTEQ